MLLKSVPAVNGDLIVPPVPKLGSPAVLWLKFDGTNFLEWILLFVPDDADTIKEV